MALQQSLLQKKYSQLQKQIQLLQKDQPTKQQIDQKLPLQTKFLRIQQLIILLIIMITSFQVYDLTTNKLDHSRNFVRFLNYYLIDHTDFGFYWVGQYALNYPVQQYFQLTQVVQFFQRLENTTKQFDQYVYGFMDFEEFMTNQNSIFLQNKKTGNIEQYTYIISQGFRQPFSVADPNSIKQSLLSSQQLKIVYCPFVISNHQWQLSISLTKFSQTSILVQIHAKQTVQNLYLYHLSTFVMGIIFLTFLIRQYVRDKKTWIQNIPDYMLCIFLINTFVMAMYQGVDFQSLLIFDGIQCCIAWILILKFIQKEDDYHISFLLKKSYVLVGRIFVSFGPIFIAFTLFGYILFCRQAWQFSSFRRTFLNLFYICYYNMTYESFIVTSRTNPISMIFFFSFVIIFTICVYSGMLVSVFCSYVWNKREDKIKQDIINNLKIQCSSCDYKYKYIDCVKLMKDPKRSQKLKMSFIMQVDFSNPDQKYKYKVVLTKKINHLMQKMLQLMDQNKKQTIKKQMKPIVTHIKTDYFINYQGKVKQLLKDLKENQIKNKIL